MATISLLNSTTYLSNPFREVNGEALKSHDRGHSHAIKPLLDVMIHLKLDDNDKNIHYIYQGQRTTLNI